MSKKVKIDLDIESSLTISSASNGQRVLILDASKEVIESIVTDVELSYVSGVTSPLQAQLALKADLVGGKVPASQIPAIAIVEVFSVADITARDALVIGTADGEIQEGDVVIVTDASADPQITAGAASYIYNGADYSLLKSGDEVLSINGQTGIVILDADDISDAATINKFATAAQLAKIDFITVTQAVDLDVMESDVTANNAKVSADGSVTSHSDVTDAGSGLIITYTERTDLGSNTTARHDALTLSASQVTQHAATLAGQLLTLIEATPTTHGIMRAEDKSKLNGIEVLADVTDATNVDAAGAVMESDATTANMSFVIDEDTMVSDSDTKVPTQQSVKAYIDTNAGNKSVGDIKETSATLADNQVSAADITGLLFPIGTVRSFISQISIIRDTTYEVVVITGIQKATSFDMTIEAAGDETGIEFSITAAGQVQYTSTSTGDTAAIKFRADTLSV